ncbi:LPS export ABC transporter permease LptF [Geobacter sp. DSM 9736]|uniref:LPS export ABC transporter permease LptF n=1 Tax=Geobacter sp. DSM 9736 TaxID=1277350 RepID=UPI000B5053A5|nr:LPS export ABC transporter permease LptF [Geobacter sp. DSM 9736]SNB46397.1 lipopolysaccharide export system permease protein [Geobacter sp. DSM 9736]
MKRTLHLYLFRETLVPFLLGIATFTSVLLMGRLLKLADMVVAKGVPLSDVLRLVLYLLPFFCLVTIPMAFLLAILLAFGRLSADSEITAMKSGGISIYGMLPPVLAFALLAYAATSFITMDALPRGNVAFKKAVIELARSRADLALKEQVFIDEFPGIVMYINRYDQERRLMSGILLQDERNPAAPLTIFAGHGSISSSEDNILHLRLHEGSIHSSLGPEGYRLIRFRDYDLSVNLARKEDRVETDEEDMTFAQLRSEIARGTGGERRTKAMLIEYHRRISLPFACFVFALVGVPLGIQNQRSGKAAGFSLSLGVILGYYILFSAGKTLTERGLLHPAAATWAPNILFLLLGAYLLRTTAAERRITLFVHLTHLTNHLRKRFGRGRHTR